MNRTHQILLAIILVSFLGDAAGAQDRQGPFAPVSDDPNLPRVLLLGDSISIGYTQPVRRMLRGQANVHRAPENCGPTTRGLEKLDAWLGDGDWDLIHFNFGLHDLKYIDQQGRRVPPNEGRVQVPLEQYADNLRQLVARLQRTGAKLVWCTTTPVPDGAHGRIVGDGQRYNETAARVIREVGQGTIAVNDLYDFAFPRLADLQRPADVHFLPEGSRQLAMRVVGVIRRELELPDPTPGQAQGVVYEDVNGSGSFDDGDRPLSGVRVSNGWHIVATDQQGRYNLPVNDDSILFVIKPRGYRTPLNENNLPRFYYIHKPYGSPGLKYAGVAPTGALPESVDFPLHAQNEPEQFKALMFGDPQPRNQAEVDYIAHDVVEELIGTDASFGVTLGDIVFDDLSLFESQARMIALLGIPWYNVIGNHDINYDARQDQHSDETFEREFGPAYYSFDYGPVHFLVLDNVEWFIAEPDGKGSYRGGLGPRQLEFIRNDLASIPAEQLVVLMMHIPLNDVRDRHDLYRLIEQRPFCMSIAAHLHRHQHRLIGKEDGWLGPEPHHHIVNVTVSGNWWAGAKDERAIPHTMMADGAPNGYSTLTFDGNRYRLEFKAAGRPPSYQMSVHAPEEVASSDTAAVDVYANVFNGSDQTRVEMKLGEGSQWRPMRKTEAEDPFFQRLHRMESEIVKRFEAAGDRPPWTPLGSPRPSTHLWRAELPANLPAGTYLIQIRGADPDGQEYHGRRVIRIISN